MADRLEAISGTRFYTNTTPSFVFSYVEHTAADDRLLGGQNLLDAPAPTLSIYSVGLGQYWNGAAYQAAETTVALTELTVGSYKYYSYTAPVGLMRGVPDTLILSATGNSIANQTISAHQAIEVSYDISDVPVPDSAFAAGDVVTKFDELLAVLKLTHFNNQEIDDLTKRLVHFKNDGVTSGLRYNLKDAQGNLSAREVFKKELT